MSILILSHTEVEQLLPMNECIEVMKDAFTSLAHGEFHQPLRTITKPSDVKGVMALMPTFRAGATPLFGLKAICVFPGNADIGNARAPAPSANVLAAAQSARARIFEETGISSPLLPLSSL